MNFFSKLFAPRLQKKEYTFFNGLSGGIFTAGSSLSNEGYCLNPSVYASVNKIVKAIVQMKLYVAKKGDEEGEPIEGTLTDLLNNPDENQGQTDWLEEYFSYYLIYGNSLIYKMSTDDGLNAGVPQQLKIISQREVQIITKMTPFGEMLDYYLFNNGIGRVIDNNLVFHGKTFNPHNQAIGLSPLVAGGLSIDLDNSAKRHNVSLLQNGATPSGVYSFKEELTPMQISHLKKQIDDQTGTQNAGRPKIVDGGATYTQTSMSSNDGDFHLAQLLSKREVASIYGIAPQLIGDTESQTFANFEQAVLSLHNDTAKPLLELFIGQLNVWLTPDFGDDIEIRIDTSGVEALQVQKKNEWAKIDVSSELTINEKRALKGFDAIPNGDVVVINGQTLDQIIKGQVSFGAFGKGEKSLKTFNKQDYFDMQSKAMTENEDEAIEESKKLLDKYFNDQLSDIESNIKKVETDSEIMAVVKAVVGVHTPELKKVYDTIYKDIALDHTLKARKKYQTEARLYLKSIKEKPQKPPSPFLILDKFKKEYDKYVDDYFKKIAIGELIKNVNKTTVDMVDRVVTESVKEGLSIFDISKAIRTQYEGSMTEGRSERIARTEALRGMSFASHEAQKKINPKVMQEWISAGDSRVREPDEYNEFDHESAGFANGKVSLQEGFRVSGESMMFPRDTSKGASAGNVINCRCTVGYIDEEFESFFQD